MNKGLFILLIIGIVGVILASYNLSADSANNYINSKILKINAKANPSNHNNKIVPKNGSGLKRNKDLVYDYTQSLAVNQPSSFYYHHIYGVNIGLPFALQFNQHLIVNGVDLSLLFTNSETKGLQLSPVNISKYSIGAEIGIVNYGTDFTGLQMSILNFTKQSNALQIGLLNFMPNGFLPVFPLINFNSEWFRHIANYFSNMISSV
ncbi:MAG TPA: hypothetical protein QF753_20090 [Victivallales bacterium]|nr:hypothetical protein [Victivallales bacterium]